MTDPEQSSDTRLPHLPARKADSHKGDYGRALLIGGSRGMSGAIALSAMSCLRGGAGLVRVAVPDVIQTIVSGFEPSYMTIGLPCDDQGHLAKAAIETLLDQAKPMTAVAIGPGLGRSADLDQLVAELYQQLSIPMVVDADALNALSEQPNVLRAPGGPRVLTPHPGEFKRLTGGEDLSPDELARQTGTVIVLKGDRTQITDGTRRARNGTGNPGMATGGTGDVLTGLTTAMICQGLPAWDAARLAVHIHGVAGDLAASELSEVAMIASDLIRFLPAAIRTR